MKSRANTTQAHKWGWSASAWTCTMAGTLVLNPMLRVSNRLANRPDVNFREVSCIGFG